MHQVKSTSFERSIKRVLVVFLFLIIGALTGGLYKIIQWSDAVRLNYQKLSAAEVASSGTVSLEQTEQKTSETALSAHDSEVPSAQAAVDLPATTTTTLPVYEALARTPLIPTCEKLGRILNPRQVLRLKEEKSQGLSEQAGHLKKLFKLVAASAFMDFMARLPHNYALMYSYDKDPSALKKLEYAAEVLLARQELDQNLDRLREIENRSYRTYFIAAAMIDNPDLIGDSSFQRACETIADMTTPMSIEQSNSIVEQMLQRAQVKAEDLEFDSGWISHTGIESNSEGYHYYGGHGDLLNKLYPKSKALPSESL